MHGFPHQRWRNQELYLAMRCVTQIDVYVLVNKTIRTNKAEGSTNNNEWRVASGMQDCCKHKKALKENRNIVFEPFKYENSITFQFIEKKTWLGKKAFKANNVVEWYDECRKRGLEDIKLLTPVDVKSRNLLGFSNAKQKLLICFYKDGHVTFFTAHWDFQEEKQLWNITYTEHSWNNPPREKPSFHDNTNDFVKVLHEIEEFARIIDCDLFADLFHKAALDATGELTKETKMTIALPKKNLKLFRAASIADVFGAMGSWNDSPPYMAHEKNLAKQYKDLSMELYRQMTLATLYAVNEW